MANMNPNEITEQEFTQQIESNITFYKSNGYNDTHSIVVAIQRSLRLSEVGFNIMVSLVSKSFA